MSHDVVNNPKHYNQGKYEVIEIIKDVTSKLPGDEGYFVGNIIKYLARYYFKNGIEDLEKARWYSEELVKLVKEKEQSNDEGEKTRYSYY